MSAQLIAGWLVVDCDASSAELVHIGVGDGFDIAWQPAFRDTIDGHRVAKVRPPAVAPGTAVTLWLRVGEAVTKVGSQRL